MSEATQSLLEETLAKNGCKPISEDRADIFDVEAKAALGSAQENWLFSATATASAWARRGMGEPAGDWLNWTAGQI